MKNIYQKNDTYGYNINNLISTQKCSLALTVASIVNKLNLLNVIYSLLKAKNLTDIKNINNIFLMYIV